MGAPAEPGSRETGSRGISSLIILEVPAHEWGHSEELAKVVRGRILQEQARLVWVERGRGCSSNSSEA